MDESISSYKQTTNAMLARLTPREFEKYFESILIDSGVGPDRAKILQVSLVQYRAYVYSIGYGDGYEYGEER